MSQSQHRNQPGGTAEGGGASRQNESGSMVSTFQVQDYSTWDSDQKSRFADMVASKGIADRVTVLNAIRDGDTSQIEQWNGLISQGGGSYSEMTKKGTKTGT